MYKDKATRKAANRRNYIKRLMAGLCAHCSLPSVGGTTMCEHHREYYREKSAKTNKQNRKYAIDNRLCERCWTPLEPEEGRTCMNCSSKKLRKEMTYAAYSILPAA